MSILTACILVALMIVLSAFFSGMEISFVGSNKLRMEIDRKQSADRSGGGFFNFVAGLFTRNGGQYIASMLVGNNIVLVIYSLAVSALVSGLLGRGSVLLETFVATVIIVFLGEYIPKSLALKNPNFYFRVLSFPVWVFYILLWPVAKFTTLISKGLIRLFGQRTLSSPDGMFTRAELVDLVEETDIREAQNEVKLFQNALDFPDLLTRDCMVQRINVEAIEAREPIAELTKRFVETKYSRIFVWRETIDNIIGYVNVKSLFLSPRTIEDALVAVDYVPETMPAQELMDLFIKRHSSIAVVIDEFGGTAGVVSLEDVLEEIFGEIEDEHDTPDLVERALDDGGWVFSAALEVDYLNEKYDLGIPVSDEYDTLAGYILFHYEDIPPQGEVLTVDGHEIKILRRTSSRIELVRVKII